MAPSATSPNASPDSTGNAGQPVKVGQSAKVPSDIAELSYEQARDELVAIVARLEAGQAPLEESMTLWERGEALAAHCTAWLDDAQARIAISTTSTPAEGEE